jgi:leucyl/phenylalanyl-tRNA--protein transferase
VCSSDLTWIDDRIVAIYVELHRMGIAHSVEVWRDGELAGGFYGVRRGGAFFGES